MRTLTVETGSGKKGRSFSVVLVAYATADALWDGARDSDNTRPAFLQVACTEAVARAFLANLQDGRRAWMKGDSCYSMTAPVELLRSAGYQFRTQRLRAGVVVTAFLPALFVFDPGLIDPAGIRFVLMPPQDRIAAEATRLGTDRILADVDALLGSVIVPKLGRYGEEIGKTTLRDTWSLEQRAAVPAMAALFCAALDRRTALPILPDLTFQMQLYLAMLGRGLASWSVEQERGRVDETFGHHKGIGFYEWGAEQGGLAAGVACMAKHEQLEPLLAEQVEIFERRTRR